MIYDLIQYVPSIGINLVSLRPKKSGAFSSAFDWFIYRSRTFGSVESDPAVEEKEERIFVECD